ncbi:flagellar motor switch protein FliG [Horticoccus sp. 23ND18S-11]|uniref:flagellar motor switch protein FliG n=1 Tax=Horticoccus sp. 23ND18S-11 TaxID=3391832 RepID=UPI0039C989AD
MSDTDYSKLSRPQRLAIFLIIIGPEAAAEVLRQFGDAEIEVICREMSTFTVVPTELQKLSLEEFSPLVARSMGSALGGMAFAQRTLEIAKGDYKASAIVGRIGPGGGSSIEVIKEISEMEGRQIFNLLKSEQPQTISFLLSYLDGAKAAEVFALLGPELREEVVERLGTIESTSLDLVNKIAGSLHRHCARKLRPSFHQSGGVRVAADLINQLDKEMSKELITRLEERNATLGAAIRKKLFSFEDINRLQASDLQRVLREVDSANLATGMKSASAMLRDRIYGSISKRAAESLKEEIEMLGAVRLKDVEAAQEAIIAVVRRLEEEGQISLDAEGADSVVS